ncbi:MAG: hypothetical protein ACI8XX_000650 [Polaribacter sp.]
MKFTRSNKMKASKYSLLNLGLTTILLAMLLTGCGEITDTTETSIASKISENSGTGGTGGTDGTDGTGGTSESVPISISFVPANDETSVLRNSSIVATFSGLLGIDTIKDASFTILDANNNAPEGDLTVDESSKAISFKPTDADGFLANTVYTVTLTAIVNGENKAHISRFTTTEELDTIVPLVSSFSPASTGIPVNRSIIAVFSESLDPSTVNSDIVSSDDNDTDTDNDINSFIVTYLVDGVVTMVDGKVVYSETDKQATFKQKFDLDLEPNTTYTATITTHVKDLAGNALENPVSWTFTTGTIISVEPVDGAESVPINSQVVAFFSEALDAAAVASLTFEVRDPDNNSAPGGSHVYDNDSKSVRFNHDGNNFAQDTVYTATITTVSDANFTNNYVWSFKTGVQVDTDPPTVVETTPKHEETGAATNRIISATFNELLDPFTVEADGTFTVADGSGNPVLGTVTYENKLISFTPNPILEEATTYTATITTAVEDLAGNQLKATADTTDAPTIGYVWTFVTGAAAQGPAPPNLRAVGGFTVLTKAGITNTGTHGVVIMGDIGSSPITASAMNDIYCDEMSGGLIYGVDLSYTGGTGGTGCSRGGADSKTLVDKAILDLEAAYTAAAENAEEVITEYGSGIIPKLDANGEAMPLSPGLYKWGTNVVMNATITLQGGKDPDGDGTYIGGENDVWIFQIGGNLAQAGETDMILTGGAQASNVFWQLTENVAIGGGAHLVGNVFAKTHIALGLLARVTGRLLSQTQVNLNRNTVIPPPSGP